MESFRLSARCFRNFDSERDIRVETFLVAAATGLDSSSEKERSFVAASLRLLVDLSSYVLVNVVGAMELTFAGLTSSCLLSSGFVTLAGDFPLFLDIDFLGGLLRLGGLWEVVFDSSSSLERRTVAAEPAGGFSCIEEISCDKVYCVQGNIPTTVQGRS